MRADSSNPSSDRGKWANRLLRRNHAKLVYESSDHADADILERAQNCLKTLQQEFEAAEFLFDRTAKGNIHRLFVRGEDDKIDDLFVESKRSIRKRATDESKILQTIPKRFWVIGIFGYFDSEEKHAQAQARAKTLLGS